MREVLKETTDFQIVAEGIRCLMCPDDNTCKINRFLQKVREAGGNNVNVSRLAKDAGLRPDDIHGSGFKLNPPGQYANYLCPEGAGQVEIKSEPPGTQKASMVY